MGHCFKNIIEKKNTIILERGYVDHNELESEEKRSIEHEQIGFTLVENIS